MKFMTRNFWKKIWRDSQKMYASNVISQFFWILFLHNFLTLWAARSETVLLQFGFLIFWSSWSSWRALSINLMLIFRKLETYFKVFRLCYKTSVTFFLILGRYVTGNILPSENRSHIINLATITFSIIFWAVPRRDDLTNITRSNISITQIE